VKVAEGGKEGGWVDGWALAGGWVELVDCWWSDGWRRWKGGKVAVIKAKSLSFLGLLAKMFLGGVSYGRDGKRDCGEVSRKDEAEC